MPESCCSTAKGGVCSLRTSKPGVCPSCGKKGKPVAVLTVKSLVRDHTSVPASVFYSFCRTVDCEVVYFSDQAVFNKPDLKVRVGIKETADPIPLCYCFDYGRADVRRDQTWNRLSPKVVQNRLWVPIKSLKILLIQRLGNV